MVEGPILSNSTRPISRHYTAPMDVQISLVGRHRLADEIYRQLRAAILEER